MAKVIFKWIKKMFLLKNIFLNCIIIIIIKFKRSNNYIYIYIYIVLNYCIVLKKYFYLFLFIDLVPIYKCLNALRMLKFSKAQTISETVK